MRVLVVGLATTGASVASYTLRRGSRGHRARRPAAARGRSGRRLPRPRRARRPRAARCSSRTRRRRRPPRWARVADLVVPSPGVGPTIPRSSPRTRPGCRPVRDRPRRGRLRARPDGPPLIAVTGTNGKTTVTTLIAAILARPGSRASPPATSAARCSTPPATTSTSSSPRCRRSSSRSPPTRSRPTWRCCSTWPRPSRLARLDRRLRRRQGAVFAHQGLPTLLVVNGDDPVGERARGRRARERWRGSAPAYPTRR